jgi:hypothetical protein
VKPAPPLATISFCATIERMSQKMIWLGMFVGSTAGGYVPTLFGCGFFSGWGLLGSVVGGVAGVFAGYKLGERWGG